MSLRFFEGPAGSGKTTQLMAELASILNERPLDAYERVLAITKMHGSRQRMKGRLLAVPRLRHQFECITVDSFAWRILRRWRSLANVRFGTEPDIYEYEEVCRRAGVLLNEPLVANWMTRSFPIVIIDEMQDSKGGQLTIIQGLSRSAICLAAADDYQDLDGDEVNIAVNWARDYAEVITLKHNHRTTATGLLEAANALREGRFIPPRGKGFVVLGARNHNAGAGFVSRNLTWWRHCTDIAIITPVRPENSNFVQNLISRVEQGPIGERQYGPYQLPWEVSPDDEQTEFLAKLNLPDDSSATVRASDILLPDNSSLSLGITAWLDNQRRIRGQTMFSVDEIKHQIQSIQQRTRTYRRVRSQGVRAMTIHQAKNREFDSVIVLWPYEVQGSPERLRRLLYNAITRAKRQALVVVQNPNRLNQAPFI